MDKIIQSEKENYNYLQNTVNPLFHRIYKHLLIDKPADLIDYLIEWLRKEKRGENNEIKTIFPNIKKFEMPTIKVEDTDHSKKYPLPNQIDAHDSQSDSDDEDPEIELKPKKFERTSVSAEAYGQFNLKKEFVPKTINKSEEQIKNINEIINQVWMLSNVGKEEKEVLIKVMEEKKFRKGDILIKQGDKYGQHMFIVDRGELECSKTAIDGSQKFLRNYKRGEAFGELALLYNCPRAATITCFSDECTVFTLDREAFNNIVKDATSKKREKYEKLLGKIDLLKNVEEYEKMQIIDALKPEFFQKGQYIIKQGEIGNTFYFVDSGEAVATKNSINVLNYKSGDYFGELALLRNEPRAASVVASTDISLLSMDRLAFQRLLGPLEDIMSREMNKYK